MEVYHGAVDKPDERNWKYNNVFGDISSDELPEEIRFLPDTIYNQWIDPIMRMSCTRQSPVHIINAQNLYVSTQTQRKFSTVDVKPIWVEAVNNNPNISSEWDLITNWLSQCKNKWLITWYSIVSTIDEMKHSISKWRLIATGSNNWNWNTVRNTHLYEIRTDWRVVWHAFCIVGYNELGWVAVNSYWEDNWVFTIPYNLTDTLYTRFSVSDTKDESYIINYKQSIMNNITIESAKEWYKLWLWDGTRPNDPITRQESVAVAYRLYENLISKINQNV